MPGRTHATLSFMVWVLVRVGFLVPGGTHATLSFVVWVLVRVGFLVPGGIHGSSSFMVLVLVRLGFLVPGGSHATLSFIVSVLVRVLVRVGFLAPGGTCDIVLHGLGTSTKPWNGTVKLLKWDLKCTLHHKLGPPCDPIIDFVLNDENTWNI